MVTAPPKSETVTFLFTDIEGSTRLWEANPESMGLAIARHDEILRRCVEEQGGRVFKSLGDSIYAAFDDSVSAVRAAVLAQRMLFAEPWTMPQPLRVRMAVHTGVCEARDGDYFGRPLNRTARLLAIGHGGQILMSGRLRDIVIDRLPDGASLIPLGEHRLRDLSRPEIVFGLVHRDLPASFPPLRSAGRADVAHNLPETTTTFVGRESELESIETALAETRLLTLTGSGGCGKTRLALQVALESIEGFDDGAWFVELAPVTDPDLVAQAVGRALQVPEGGVNGAERALVEFLRERRLLLVLDNCEHLLDACGVLADHLLRASSGLKILATSREGLGIAGERIYRVPSLSLPGPEAVRAEDVLSFEAPRLFAERAAFHRQEFTVTDENAAALGALCRRLDGIPLAIELAAARIRALTVEQIDARLDDRFRLLTGGSRSALPRQQTLRALVDWSHSLLSDVERTTLRRLSVFVGGWTLESSEAVVPGGLVESYDVLDLLGSLVDKSLVQTEEREGATRYRLLETVRQYALEKLMDAGEAEELRGRHLELFLALAEEAAPHLAGADQAQWFAVLNREHDNIRSALDHARGEKRLRLCGAMYWFWHVRKYNGEGLRRLIDALEESPDAEPTPALAKVLLGAGTLAYWGEDPRHQGFFLRALDTARVLGDRNLEGRILGNLGALSVEFRQFERAREFLGEALRIHESLGLPARMAHQYCTLGFLEREQGHPEAARQNLERAVEMSRSGGHRYLLAYSLMAAGTVAVAYGQPDAIDLLEEALRIAGDAEIGPVAAASYAWLAEARRLQGDLEEAGRLLALAEGSAPDRDRILYEIYLLLVRLRLDQGDLQGAHDAANRLLVSAERHAVPADGIEATAELLFRLGHAKPAAVLVGAASEFRRSLDMPLPSVYSAEIDALERHVRSALEEPDRSFNRGRAMTPDEAVRYARVCLP